MCTHSSVLLIVNKGTPEIQWEDTVKIILSNNRKRKVRKIHSSNFSEKIRLYKGQLLNQWVSHYIEPQFLCAVSRHTADIANESYYCISPRVRNQVSLTLVITPATPL